MGGYLINSEGEVGATGQKTKKRNTFIITQGRLMSFRFFVSEKCRVVTAIVYRRCNRRGSAGLRKVKRLINIEINA